jgi:hypothetical protein
VTKRWAGAAAFLAVALGPAALSADPTQLDAGAEASGALMRLAEAVASQVAQASAEPPVGVYVASELASLARSFATLVISDLAQRKLAPSSVNASSVEAAEATARQSGARSLARLTVGLANGSVSARGDLISTWVNFWSGQQAARNPRPAAAIAASVEADSQVLALAAAPDSWRMGRLTLGELRLEGVRLADLPRWSAALAAGDLDGDGKDEIVALTDDEILAFSADGKLLARRDHRFLGDSATPCREPFGAISIVSQRIAYFSAGRRRGELLALDSGRAELRSLGYLDEVPIAAQGEKQVWGAFVPGRSAFAPNLWTQSRERWALANPLWAVSFFPTSTGPRSLFVFADGTASWVPANSRGRRLSDAAAAMALVDIDGDGEPEIIATSPRYRADPDELRVLSALDVGSASIPPPTSSLLNVGPSDPAVAAQELWHGPVRGGSALQVVGAKLDAGKSSQIVVGVWKADGSGQLQVFRRVRP